MPRLDELARLADAGDGEATATWGIAEGKWVNDNMPQLVGADLTEYVTNTLALLQAIGAGDDQTAAVATLIGMRSDIATLAGVAVLAPTPEPTPKATPKPAPVSYTKLSSRAWKQLVKSPDKYAGKGYQVWGCIFQFDAATGDSNFLANASYKKQEYWNLYGENASFNGAASRLSAFVEGDAVLMNVISTGSYSYDTQSGGNTTVPSFDITKITRKGSCD